MLAERFSVKISASDNFATYADIRISPAPAGTWFAYGISGSAAGPAFCL